jgi:peptide/nickel transport system substrate-binding protein
VKLRKGIVGTSLAGVAAGAMLLSSVGVVAAHAAAAHKQAIKNGGQVVLAILSPPQSLDPIIDTEEFGDDVISMEYASLFDVAPNLSLVPDLALKQTVSPNGLVYTYYLRKGVKWSDGQPFTSADVVWTLDATANPANDAPGQSTFAQYVKTIKAVGLYEVQVTLKSRYAPWYFALANTAILPEHILKGVSGYKNLLANRELNNPYVGDGPFLLQSWNKAAGIITMKANPTYWRGAPHLSTIVFKVVTNSDAAYAQLRTGEVQFATIPTADWPAALHTPGVQVEKFPSLSYAYVGFNMRYWEFQDPAVRQAIIYGTNRADICKVILKGLCTVVNGMVPPISWAYDPHLNPFAYNPKKADQLLTQAGWIMQPNGYRYKHGSRLQFTIDTFTGSTTNDETMAAIQANMKSIGIYVSIKEMEFNTLVSTIFPQKPEKGVYFQAASLGWGVGPDPDQSTIFEGSSQFPPTGQDYTFYNDPTVTKLTKEELAATSLTARKAIFQQMQEQMQTDPPYMFLTSPLTLDGISSKLGGWVSNPSLPDFYDPQNWYLK